MICKFCGSDYDENMFEICPFCLMAPEGDDIQNNQTVLDEKEDTPISEEFENSEQENSDENTENISDSEFVCEEISGLGVEDTGVSQYENIEKVKLPTIKLTEIEGLSVRAKNILARNRLTKFSDLLDYLKTHRFSDLPGAGLGTEEEMANLISRLLCGEFNSEEISENYLDVEEYGSIEQKVIQSINSGSRPNLPLESISDIPIRIYNICKRQGVNDVLGLATLVNTVPVKDIRGVGRIFIEEVPKFLERFLSGAYTNEFEETNISTTLEGKLIETRGTRAYEIFLRRANGETLQEIADNLPGENAEGITRERVRQIESKFHRNLRRMLNGTIGEMVNEKGYVTGQDLADLFGDDEFGTIMSHSLKMDDSFEYLDFADCFVKKTDGPREEIRVLNLVSDFVGDGLNLYDKIELLEELFVRNNVPYMGLGELINLLEKSGYRVYGEYVTKGKVSYAVLCKYLVSEYFPSGIKLNQDDTTKCEDLDRLRELANKKFGDIGIPDSDRAFSARLGSYMVSCDRGRVIPEDRIVIDLSLLNDIKSYIDDLDVAKIYYSEVYAHFEGVLNLTSNGNNYYFLHGVLMLYFPEEYIYSRDYLVRKDYDGESANNADRIRNYINKVGHVVTRNELKVRFPGFSNIMIDLMFDEDSRLLQWDYNEYSSVDLLSISNYERDSFRELLYKMLRDNGGFVSETILYEELTQYAPEFLEKNRIAQPINAFYIFSKLYSDMADFRHPNIGEKGKVDSLTIRDIALYLLGNNRFIRYSDFLKIVERMKWPAVSASTAFGKIEGGYLRRSEDEYVIEEDFYIQEDTVSSIRSCLRMMMSDWYLPLVSIEDYSEFPETRYEWNSFLLESIVKKYLAEYKIISPEYKDRRYQKGILVESNSTIASYPELVARVFKDAGYAEMTEGQFLAFLVVHGLARQVVPRELSCSQYFSLEKETYKLKTERG